MKAISQEYIPMKGFVFILSESFRKIRSFFFLKYSNEWEVLGNFSFLVWPK